MVSNNAPKYNFLGCQFRASHQNFYPITTRIQKSKFGSKLSKIDLLKNWTIYWNRDDFGTAVRFLIHPRFEPRNPNLTLSNGQDALKKFESSIGIGSFVFLNLKIPSHFDLIPIDAPNLTFPFSNRPIRLGQKFWTSHQNRSFLDSWF